MQAVKEWFHAFLQARSMDKADGQMLFRYRATQAEYQELKMLFSERLAALRGTPWKFESRAEAALFVLYASEWWRREYVGGAWRWTSIFESLTTEPYRVDPVERSAGIEFGLRAWGHRPSEDGKKYLGAIVAHGGLPLKMLAQGDGVISRLLLSATRKAQLLGWGEQQLMDYFDSRREDLVQHLRATEIYRLLAEMVLTVLSLRTDYKLAGVGNPVSVLDQVAPQWRERFPIAVDDHSVEPLLIGLVKEASRQINAVTAYPVSVVRTLELLADGDSYALSMAVEVPSSIAVDALASAMQVSPLRVPQSFVLEIAGNQRVPLGQGRQLLGSQSSTVLLSGRPKRFFGKDVCQEVLLALRSIGADVVSPVSVPGGEAMDESQPWTFVPLGETLTLMGTGSCKVASETAYVLVQEHWELKPDNDALMEHVGLVKELAEPRRVYKVQGSIEIVAEDNSYTIRTNSQSVEDEQLVWKGHRLWCHSSPFPVFQGVPRLCRLDAEGVIHPIPEKDIEWAQAVRKGERLLNVKAHRGSIDAWWMVEGKRQRRFRMALVAPDARIVFKSGETECEGSVEFHGWGITALHACPQLSTVRSGAGDVVSLSMSAQGQPPSNVMVTAEWSPALPVLRIELPFPATGGRFARSDGSVLPDGASLTLKRGHDVHVQVFDRNPSVPKRYRLELQLRGKVEGNRLRRAEVEIPLDANGIGDLRFFEIEATLNGLLCQSDHLDASLEVKLLAGAAPVRTLRINRYDVEFELEREVQSFALPEAQLRSISADQLQGIDLRAIPLLERGQEPQGLKQLTSDQQPVGRWSVAALPAGHGPWLIYPSDTSLLLTRPTLWTTTASSDTLLALDDGGCPLAKAMSSSVPEDRSSDLAEVIAAMAADFEHPSWKLVAHHYTHLKHLPLNTLDYWRVIGRNQNACLAAVLKFPMDLHELMSRMRDELGVMWEFTSRESLKRAYESLSASFVTLLGDSAPKEIVGQFVNDLFSKVGFVSEAIATQVDRILFEETGARSARFDQLISDFNRPPVSLLQKLWQGEDSHLQRVLLRNQAETTTWPSFMLWKELLNEIDQGDRRHVEFVSGLGRQLLLTPGGPLSEAKLDVANAPLLTGFLIHVCDANKWLQASDHMAQLRQIKTFDPTWFEIGIQTGAILAMKAEEQSAKARLSR